MNPLKFFIDFDGTITKSDVVDMILERFADSQWRAVEEEWRSGRIGSRECLGKQMALVRTDEKTFFEFLKTVQMDLQFPQFLNLARQLQIPVAIASDGFREIIESVLRVSLNGSRGLLADIPIFSNALRWSGERVGARFATQAPCEHGCANCKVRVIEENSSVGDTVVFVGDGLSHRFAARRADEVFAKGTLLEHCTKNKITCHRYSDFGEISDWLKQIKGGAVAVRKRSS